MTALHLATYLPHGEEWEVVRLLLTAPDIDVTLKDKLHESTALRDTKATELLWNKACELGSNRR